MKLLDSRDKKIGLVTIGKIYNCKKNAWKPRKKNQESKKLSHKLFTLDSP